MESFLDLDVAAMCCCGDTFIAHDPSHCTRCPCRGFHSPEADKALHAALDRKGELRRP